MTREPGGSPASRRHTTPTHTTRRGGLPGPPLPGRTNKESRRADSIPLAHSPLPIPLTHPIPCPLLRQRTVDEQGAMENRNIQLEDREFIEEMSLSDAERHALIEFFQRLDRWDRELVQNRSRNEVKVCRVQ